VSCTCNAELAPQLRALCILPLAVWSADDLQLVRVLRGHRGSVLCLLAVGNLLLSGARDNLIRVWDLDMDFMCKRTLTGHQDDVVHLSAVTMKRRYATAGDGNFSSAR
jgi:WD40 repeat protein